MGQLAVPVTRENGQVVWVAPNSESQKQEEAKGGVVGSRGGGTPSTDTSHFVGEPGTAVNAGGSIVYGGTGGHTNVTGTVTQEQAKAITEEKRYAAYTESGRQGSYVPFAGYTVSGGGKSITVMPTPYGYTATTREAKSIWPGPTSQDRGFSDYISSTDQVSGRDIAAGTRMYQSKLGQETIDVRPMTPYALQPKRVGVLQEEKLNFLDSTSREVSKAQESIELSILKSKSPIERFGQTAGAFEFGAIGGAWGLVSSTIQHPFKTAGGVISFFPLLVVSKSARQSLISEATSRPASFAGSMAAQSMLLGGAGKLAYKVPLVKTANGKVWQGVKDFSGYRETSELKITQKEDIFQRTVSKDRSTNVERNSVLNLKEPKNIVSKTDKQSSALAFVETTSRSEIPRIMVEGKSRTKVESRNLLGETKKGYGKQNLVSVETPNLNIEGSIGGWQIFGGAIKSEGSPIKLFSAVETPRSGFYAFETAKERINIRAGNKYTEVSRFKINGFGDFGGEIGRSKGLTFETVTPKEKVSSRKSSSFLSEETRPGFAQSIEKNFNRLIIPQQKVSTKSTIEGYKIEATKQETVGRSEGGLLSAKMIDKTTGEVLSRTEVETMAPKVKFGEEKLLPDIKVSREVTGKGGAGGKEFSFATKKEAKLTRGKTWLETIFQKKSITESTIRIGFPEEKVRAIKYEKKKAASKSKEDLIFNKEYAKKVNQFSSWRNELKTKAQKKYGKDMFNAKDMNSELLHQGETQFLSKPKMAASSSKSTTRNIASGIETSMNIKSSPKIKLFSGNAVQNRQKDKLFNNLDNRLNLNLRTNNQLGNQLKQNKAQENIFNKKEFISMPKFETKFENIVQTRQTQNIITQQRTKQNIVNMNFLSGGDFVDNPVPPHPPPPPPIKIKGGFPYGIDIFGGGASKKGKAKFKKKYVASIEAEIFNIKSPKGAKLFGEKTGLGVRGL